MLSLISHMGSYLQAYGWYVVLDIRIGKAFLLFYHAEYPSNVLFWFSTVNKHVSLRILL